MRIDRCVCYDVLFAELKSVARERDCASIPALQEHVAFGLNCRLCHPYVERMLETGEVRFSTIIKSVKRDPPPGRPGT